MTTVLIPCGSTKSHPPQYGLATCPSFSLIQSHLGLNQCPWVHGFTNLERLKCDVQLSNGNFHLWSLEASNTSPSVSGAGHDLLFVCREVGHVDPLRMAPIPAGTTVRCQVGEHPRNHLLVIWCFDVFCRLFSLVIGGRTTFRDFSGLYEALHIHTYIYIYIDRIILQVSLGLFKYGGIVWYSVYVGIYNPCNYALEQHFPSGKLVLSWSREQQE